MQYFQLTEAKTYWVIRGLDPELPYWIDNRICLVVYCFFYCIFYHFLIDIECFKKYIINKCLLFSSSSVK